MHGRGSGESGAGTCAESGAGTCAVGGGKLPEREDSSVTGKDREGPRGLECDREDREGSSVTGKDQDGPGNRNKAEGARRRPPGPFSGPAAAWDSALGRMMAAAAVQLHRAEAAARRSDSALFLAHAQVLCNTRARMHVHVNTHTHSGFTTRPFRAESAARRSGPALSCLVPALFPPCSRLVPRLFPSGRAANISQRMPTCCVTRCLLYDALPSA